eukprot:s3_g15.t4
MTCGAVTCVTGLHGRHGGDSDLRVALTKRVVTLGKRRAWQQALELLKDGKEAGFDVAFCSALISACRGGSAWQSALQLCFGMAAARVVPNCASYSSVIAACREQWQQGLDALRLAAAQLLQLNQVCFGAAINVCSWQQSLQLLQAADRKSLGASVVAGNAAVSGCTRGTGTWFRLRLLWRKGLDLAKDMLDRPTVQASHVTLNAAITACDAGHDASLAVKVLRSMEQLRFQPDVVSYNAALSACGNSIGHWSCALQLSLEALQKSLRLDLVSLGAAVNALSSTWRRAQEMLLRCYWIEPNAYVKSSFLKGLAQDLQWPSALHRLRDGVRDGEGEEISCGATADACAGGGRWGEAQELMRWMCGWQLRLGAFSFHATLEALRDDWQYAFQILSNMEELQVQKEATSLSVALGVCERSGNWEASLDLFDLSVSRRLKSDLVSFNGALSALCNGHAVRPALRLMRQMRDVSVQGDLFGFNGLISAYVQRRSWHQGLQQLQRLRDCSVFADAVSRRALLAGGGLPWPLSFHVLDQMKDPSVLALHDASSSCGASAAPAPLPWILERASMTAQVTLSEGAKRMKIMCSCGLCWKAGFRYE